MSNAPLSAQSIAPRADVRITPIDGSVKPHEGTFLKSSGDPIWFMSKKSNATLWVSLRNALKVEHSTHYKRQFPRAAIGTVIGLGLVNGVRRLFGHLRKVVR